MNKGYWLAKIMCELGLAAAGGEARRLIYHKVVFVNNQLVTDINKIVYAGDIVELRTRQPKSVTV